MSLKVFIMFLRHAFTSQIKKNQQKIATEQIKTARRSKRITFKTRESQNKALKMKNRRSKCLNHLTELTISNLKCHIKSIQKSKNHQRHIFLDNYYGQPLSSVKFGETCNFEIKCLLSILFFLGMLK
jgi:cystathionine beta-lyase family protein involved in aluminum resistance